VKAVSGEQGIALERFYQFVLWLIPTVEKFPRSQLLADGSTLHTSAAAIGRAVNIGIPSRERFAALNDRLCGGCGS